MLGRPHMRLNLPSLWPNLLNMNDSRIDWSSRKHLCPLLTPSLDLISTTTLNGSRMTRSINTPISNTLRYHSTIRTPSTKSWLTSLTIIKRMVEFSSFKSGRSTNTLILAVSKKNWFTLTLQLFTVIRIRWNISKIGTVLGTLWQPFHGTLSVKWPWMLLLETASSRLPGSEDGWTVSNSVCLRTTSKTGLPCTGDSFTVATGESQDGIFLVSWEIILTKPSTKTLQSTGTMNTRIWLIKRTKKKWLINCSLSDQRTRRRHSFKWTRRALSISCLRIQPMS